MKLNHVLFIAFVLVLVVGFIPSAYAFSGSGAGTSGDAYIITTPSQFNEMRNNLTAYYELGNSLDMTGDVLYTEPTGDWNVPFTGSFDGKGYSIDNMHWTYTDPDYTHPPGIFGVIDTGVQWMRNVNFDNYSLISLDDYATTGCCGGGFIGGDDSVTAHEISNIHFTNSLVDIRNSGEAGGVVGYSGNIRPQLFDNVSFEGDVYLGYASGGLTGYQVDFQDSYFIGNIYYNSSAWPGHASDIGGLFGYGTPDMSFINNSYVIANISALDGDADTRAVGGLAGSVRVFTKNYTIENSYFYGTLPTNVSFRVDMIANKWIPDTYDVVCSNVYYGSEPSNPGVSNNCSGGATGLTDDEFDNEISFVGFDFVTIWGVESFSTPKFQWQIIIDPFLIDSCRQITASGTYTLTQNISGVSTNNACLDIQASGVTIEAGEYKVEATSTHALRVYSSNVVINDGVFVGQNQQGTIRIETANSFTMNRSIITANLGNNANGIRSLGVTISNLVLDSVTINALGISGGAMFLNRVNGFTLINSTIIGSVDGIAGFFGGYVNNAVIHGNYIQSPNRPLVFGSGGSNSYVYDNVFKTNAVIDSTSALYLNLSGVGNTWTNFGGTGFSETCTNDGNDICVEDNVLAVGTDYEPVALTLCNSNWVCDGYDAPVCLIDDTTTQDCNSVTDTSCGETYVGNYSEFVNDTGVCDYCTPSWSCDGYFNGTCIIVNGTGSSTYSCDSVADNNSCYATTLLPSDQFQGNPATYGSGVNSCDADLYTKSAYGFAVLVALIPLMLIIGLFMSSSLGKKYMSNPTTNKVIGLVALVIIVLLLVALL